MPSLLLPYGYIMNVEQVWMHDSMCRTIKGAGAGASAKKRLTSTRVLVVNVVAHDGMCGDPL